MVCYIFYILILEIFCAEGHIMAIQEITIEQYREEFENSDIDYLLLDVREVDEFMQARLPNTINIPMSEFQFRIDEVPEDKPIILVCRTGQRSMTVAQFLHANGYEELYNLDEGTLGWVQRGLPFDKG
jgi:rhodanese-related sulfurtransferase